MVNRNDEKVRGLIAANIAHYRKECGLTQDELAEMIYYSGKSVSKWERGEGVPDIYVLVMLAEIFDVTVNDLISEKHRKRRRTQPQFKRNIITLMSLALVWLVATVAFFFIRVVAPQLGGAWLAFIVAVPVTFIVATVFTSLWHPTLLRFICISGIVWSTAMALHVIFRIENMFLIYVVAGILQLLIVLWYLLENTKLFAGLTPKRRSRKAQAQTAEAAEGAPEGEKREDGAEYGSDE